MTNGKNWVTRRGQALGEGRVKVQWRGSTKCYSPEDEKLFEKWPHLKKKFGKGKRPLLMTYSLHPGAAKMVEDVAAVFGIRPCDVLWELEQIAHSFLLSGKEVPAIEWIRLTCSPDYKERQAEVHSLVTNHIHDVWHDLENKSPWKLAELICCIENGRGLKWKPLIEKLKPTPKGGKC